MKERILGYRTRIDDLLEKNAPDTPWDEVLREHLVQVSFFQHERLIHLMVTLAFAIMGVAVILVTCYIPSIGMFILSLLFLSLLIPYIMHYYLLENETQKMYRQYDEILKHINKK